MDLRRGEPRARAPLACVRRRVAIGIGTALTDNPQLTARVPASNAEPRRVIFDSLARLPVSSRLVHAAVEVPVIVVVSRGAPQRRRCADGGRRRGPRRERRERARARALRTRAARRSGVAAILLEGGPHLAGAFLDAGEIDEVRLFLAPTLLGGASARDPLEGEGVARIADAIRALTLECEHVGEDLLISARLREW